jgi:hypothetical protein
MPLFAGGQTLVDTKDSRWGVRVFIGQSLLMLGAEDIRDGAGIGFNYTVPYKRLRYHSTPAELELEGYFHATHSGGASGKPENDTNAFGILGVGRWAGMRIFGTPTYLELGWGLQYADKRSVDLDSRLNSTPTLGIGFILHASRGQRAYLGLRLMHVSNAGFVGRNQGQNHFLGTLSVKF